MLDTFLTRAWSLRYPLIGAPMAQVALGRLARAVTSAGALGSIGIGADDPLERIASEAAIARGDDDAKFCIGVMVWALERRPELFDAVLAEKPFLVSLAFGNVAPYVARAHAAGCRVAAAVQTRADALAADAAGVDLIVVQGTEAGGHTGYVGTLPLMQIVLDAVRTPVVVAGGVATGRGLAAVLAAGAEGAWIGTPLLASPESAASPEARAAVVAAREDQTVLTSLFDRVQGIPWPAAFPGRALANDFTDRFHGRVDAALADENALAAYAAARASRDFRVAHLYAGQSVGSIHGEVSARDVIVSIGTEAEAHVKRFARRLADSDDGGWNASAQGWIDDMGDEGDYARAFVLDRPMLARIADRAFRTALDVGCGEGRFCRMLQAQGIATVGIDPTAALIERARERDAEGDYRIGRAERLPVADGSFDLVISYLSLIDIPDLAAGIAEMVRAMRPGGTLLIANLTSFNTAGLPEGWTDRGDGKLRFSIDHYLEERPIRSSWRAIEVDNWHRPLGTYIGLLLAHGLQLQHFAEPEPVGGDTAKADRYRRVPYLHIMEWRKPFEL